LSKTSRKPNTYLSKTLFMKGLQCHKALYLEKYSPELKSEPDTETLLRFEGGYEAGEYAKKLFPGGIEVPFEGLSHDEQARKTQEEIKKGTKTIYEATFFHDGIFVKLDILHKGPKGWEIYEVKASSDLKKHHINDISIQYFVTVSTGLPVKKAHIVHMNKEYVRKGDIEPQKLFVINDVTSEVINNQKHIKDNLKEIRKMLLGSEPQIDIGSHCEDPYKCSFIAHCRSHLPEHSVFKLCGSKKIMWQLYNEGHNDMHKLPMDRLEPKQRFQVEVFLNRDVITNKTVVKQFLNTLTYPICFFDFETFMQPVPPFDGVKPNQLIPFQYSLHVIERKKGPLKHYEYLAEPGKDPREEIAKGLISQIPADATVLAYHKSFEIGRMNDLITWLPKHAKKLQAIVDNIIDLKEPFSQRVAYHWKMQGSASLKVVLPAFIPDMTYEGMEISEGMAAQAAYFRMQQITDNEELKNLRKALIEYCKQDTLAMVKLWEKLQEMAK